MKRLLTGVLFILIACLTHPVFGGDLVPPGPPSGGSGMPTLLDIYNYLNSGTEPPTPGTFKEPLEGPSPTMKTTKEIYDGIKEKLDQLNETNPEHVLELKPYFDTREGYWGINEGSMVNRGAVIITPGAAAQELPEGYHNGSGMVIGDSDLLPENIKCGKTIFGVTGTLPPGCVAKTGQIECYDESGLNIDCAETGQDGEYQNGCDPEVVPWSEDDFGNYKRTSFPCSEGFTDNLDGTVTDNLTGLIWLKNANCDDWKTWVDALFFCNTLASGSYGLTDGSVAGDWRLPNINELRSLFDPTLSPPYLPAGHPFVNIQDYIYWSSTTPTYQTIQAWNLDVRDGRVGYATKTYSFNVWPVRGGE